MKDEAAKLIETLLTPVELMEELSCHFDACQAQQISELVYQPVLEIVKALAARNNLNLQQISWNPKIDEWK